MSFFRDNSYYTSRSRYGGGYRSSNTPVIIALLVFAVIAVCGIFGCSSYLKDSPVTITVTGKESVSTDSGHEYRVYTNDETYVMKDSIFKGRFRTSNDYAKLQRGHTYTCTKFGWRVPLLSWFENIRDCKETPSLR